MTFLPRHFDKQFRAGKAPKDGLRISNVELEEFITYLCTFLEWGQALADTADSALHIADSPTGCSRNRFAPHCRASPDALAQTLRDARTQALRVCVASVN